MTKSYLPTRADWETWPSEPSAFGSVKWFNNEKGFGFLRREDGLDVFAHHSRIVGVGGRFLTLIEGEPVTFKIAMEEKGASAQEILPVLRGETPDHVFLTKPDGSIGYVPTLTGPQQANLTPANDLAAVWSTCVFRNRLVARDVVEEFERLLNMKSLREAQIQEFLEEHPEILLGAEYELALPQVVLPFGDGRSLRPDFILRPLCGVSYDAQVVELKLPTQKLIKPHPPHREAPYSVVMEAVEQLRAYRRYFEEERHRSDFAKRLGFDVFRPSLALVAGRTADLPPQEIRARAMDSLAPVDLLTYDDLIIRYRNMFAG